jgi:hypothetical protein
MPAAQVLVLPDTPTLLKVMGGCFSAESLHPLPNVVARRHLSSKEDNVISAVENLSSPFRHDLVFALAYIPWWTWAILGFGLIARFASRRRRRKRPSW